jgi:hypothetical protein
VNFVAITLYIASQLVFIVVVIVVYFVIDSVRKILGTPACVLYSLKTRLFSFIVINVFRVIKSRRMRWAGHVERMGEVLTGFWLGGPKARDHWEDLGVGGRITLRWTLGR